MFPIDCGPNTDIEILLLNNLKCTVKGLSRKFIEGVSILILQVKLHFIRAERGSLIRHRIELHSASKMYHYHNNNICIMQCILWRTA